MFGNVAASKILKKLGFLSCLAVLVAACSSDSNRLSPSRPLQPVGQQSDITGSIPSGTVQSRPLTAPQGATVYSQPLPDPTRQATLTTPPQSSYTAPATAAYKPVQQAAASVPAAGSSMYSTAGSYSGTGSIVTVTDGDSLASLSRRYGVPASAIMTANNFQSPTEIVPGKSVIIPIYNANSGSPSAKSAKPLADAKNHVGLPAQNIRQDAVRLESARHDADEAVPSPLSAPRRLMAKTETAKLDVQKTDATKKISDKVTASVKEQVASVKTDVAKPKEIRKISMIPAKTTDAQDPDVTASVPATVSAKAIASRVADDAKNTTTAAITAPAAKAVAESDDDTPEPAARSGSGFRWPVRGRIVAGYSKSGQRNDGINISVPEGTSVKAAENGVVVYAGNELKGYGNLVLVRHANDYVTAYAHNSEVLVKRGDTVKRGQIISRAGQTGNVSSPQLHFEVRRGATPVDPMPYLSGS